MTKPNKIWALSLFIVLMALPGAARAAQPTENYPVVKLQSLDKATARTMTFEARVGSTIKFGQLFIRVQACRKTPPIEQPEAASFLQIWEAPGDGTPQWIFSGWMFASSPGLSSMDHPIYDVWVLDCLGSAKTAEAGDAGAEAEKTLPEAELPAPIEPETLPEEN